MKENKPRLLLSACCGPCATVALIRLKESYDTTLHFWGNNFDTENEYNKRLEALRIVNAELNNNGSIIVEPYSPQAFNDSTETLSNAPEGGERCKICYEQRGRSAATAAHAQHFDMWTTTLTSSPHKNTAVINDIGTALGDEFKIPFIAIDLKKDNGFAESVKISKELRIYRQNYCGCKYSRK